MHYLRLIRTYYRLSILNELQYRANLMMQIFSSLVQLGIGLAGIGLVLYNTDSLGGWQPAELLVVLGVYTLIAGVARSFIQPNMYELMEGNLRWQARLHADKTGGFTAISQHHPLPTVEAGRCDCWPGRDWDSP